MYCLADKFHHVKGFKMMCVRGYSTDISDAINLDEKLESVSKLPPNIVNYKISFVGKLCTCDVVN